MNVKTTPVPVTEFSFENMAVKDEFVFTISKYPLIRIELIS